MKARAQYSEAEAACEVGVSVEQLRALIRLHIVCNDEDLGTVPVTAFSPSDVLVLRLLAGSMLAGSMLAASDLVNA